MRKKKGKAVLLFILLLAIQLNAQTASELDEYKDTKPVIRVYFNIVYLDEADKAAAEGATDAQKNIKDRVDRALATLNSFYAQADISFEYGYDSGSEFSYLDNSYIEETDVTVASIGSGGGPKSFNKSTGNHENGIDFYLFPIASQPGKPRGNLCYYGNKAVSVQGAIDPGNPNENNAWLPHELGHILLGGGHSGPNDTVDGTGSYNESTHNFISLEGVPLAEPLLMHETTHPDYLIYFTEAQILKMKYILMSSKSRDIKRIVIRDDFYVPSINNSNFCGEDLTIDADQYISSSDPYYHYAQNTMTVNDVDIEYDDINNFATVNYTAGTSIKFTNIRMQRGAVLSAKSQDGLVCGSTLPGFIPENARIGISNIEPLVVENQDIVFNVVYSANTHQLKVNYNYDEVNAYTVTVYNQLGVTIKTEKVTKYNNTFSLDAMTHGIYFVKLFENNKGIESTKKIAITN